MKLKKKLGKLKKELDKTKRELSWVRKEIKKTQKEIVNTEKCPECSGRIVKNNVETYCIKCGLVVDEEVDIGGVIYDKNGDKIERPKPIIPGQALEPTQIGYVKRNN